MQLDPIDVAFYDPHLRKNSQRLYISSSVLLGALVQLHRLHKESCVGPSFYTCLSAAHSSLSKARASVNEAHNVMPTATPVQRFVTLPVPQAASDQKEGAQGAGQGAFVPDRAEDRSSLSMLTQMRRSLGLK